MKTYSLSWKPILANLTEAAGELEELHCRLHYRVFLCGSRAIRNRELFPSIFATGSWNMWRMAGVHNHHASFLPKM
jgi:hypothetical protein